MDRFLCIAAVVAGIALGSFNMAAAGSKAVTLDDLLGVPRKPAVTINAVTNTIKK